MSFESGSDKGRRYKDVRPGRFMQIESNREWAAVVVAALLELDPLEQRVLRLVYFGRHTQAEAAKRLLLSSTAVKRAVFSAMMRLAQTLEAVETPTAGV